MVENPQIEEPKSTEYRSSELVSEALHLAESSRQARKEKVASMQTKLSRAQAMRRSTGIVDPPLAAEELAAETKSSSSSWSVW